LDLLGLFVLLYLLSQYLLLSQLGLLCLYDPFFLYGLLHLYLLLNQECLEVLWGRLDQFYLYYPFFL
jgi:hypothetical protein